jgi:hypothetical protein
MKPSIRLFSLIVLTGCLFAGVAAAQLPPEAVDLAEVKIPETQKSVDLDPVLLLPSAADGPTWEYAGVAYRGAEASSKTEFMKDPDTHAAAAAKQRYINNFMTAMSTIWCPITDEVTPGGRKRVEGLGYQWESCCSFCDEEMHPDNFADALTKLRQRAEEAFELAGGVYTEGASSPVEGAIRDDF